MAYNQGVWALLIIALIALGSMAYVTTDMLSGAFFLFLNSAFVNPAGRNVILQ